MEQCEQLYKLIDSSDSLTQEEKDRNIIRVANKLLNGGCIQYVFKIIDDDIIGDKDELYKLISQYYNQQRNFKLAEEFYNKITSQMTKDELKSIFYNETGIIKSDKINKGIVGGEKNIADLKKFLRNGEVDRYNNLLRRLKLSPKELTDLNYYKVEQEIYGIKTKGKYVSFKLKFYTDVKYKKYIGTPLEGLLLKREENIKKPVVNIKIGGESKNKISKAKTGKIHKLKEINYRGKMLYIKGDAIFQKYTKPKKPVYSEKSLPNKKHKPFLSEKRQQEIFGSYENKLMKQAFISDDIQ